MNSQRVYNPSLKVDPLQTGSVVVIDATVENMLEIGLLDSIDIPSINLLRIIEAMKEQLGITWSSDAKIWDPMDRNLGGAIFISTPWMDVI